VPRRHKVAQVLVTRPPRRFVPAAQQRPAGPFSRRGALQSGPSSPAASQRLVETTLPRPAGVRSARVPVVAIGRGVLARPGAITPVGGADIAVTVACRPDRIEAAVSRLVAVPAFEVRAWVAGVHDARTAAAGVGAVAEQTVVAARGVVRVLAARRGITRVIRAHVAVVAVRRRTPGTGAVRACIAGGAGVAVVAGGAVGLLRVRTRARPGIARAHVVALVERGTHDPARPRAHAALARIRPRAGVVVVAADAVGFVRVRTRARPGIARAHVVALVERGTHDPARPRAHAALTRIGLRAGVVVVAAGPVGQTRVAADPRWANVTGPRI